jgi:hypothetical protein
MIVTFNYDYDHSNPTKQRLVRKEEGFGMKVRIITDYDYYDYPNQ